MHAKVTHVTLLIVIVITIYGYSYTSEFLDSLVIPIGIVIFVVIVI